MREEELIQEYLPHYSDFPTREIYKRIRIITLPFVPDLSGRFVAVADHGRAKVLIDYKANGMGEKMARETLPYFCLNHKFLKERGEITCHSWNILIEYIT